MQSCEEVKPYAQAPDAPSKGEQVRDMFDSIAPAYDFMNRAMTAGVHRLWQRRTVRAVAAARPARVLDVATGTADMAIALAEAMPGTEVTGVDISAGMLAIGRDKTERRGLAERITLLEADCLSLPFADATFDAVTVAYGVRNFEHLLKGYSEMARVLRPGGTLAVLELSTPRGALTAPLYRLYTRHIVPAMGRLFSHDVRAYSYLPESIAAVPQGRDMLRLMEQAGLTECRHRPMTFGACTLYTACKP